MILWLIACSSQPSLLDAVDGARARVEATGWDQAIGPFSVERIERAPREGDREQAILADATLAWFDSADRTLTITDAALHGPRWRGEPDTEAEALVRTCPDRLLGPWTLEELVVHELGHGALVSTGIGRRRTQLRNWGALAGWEQRRAGRWQPVTGMRGAGLLHEEPKVAIRLCRGEPRGEGAYRTSDAGFTSDYAKVDPIEDMAEAFRLYHRDPAALAQKSPARYLALATPSAWGGRHVPAALVPAAIVPGLTRLFETTPDVAAEVLRTHGEALRPHIDPLAREPYTGPAAKAASRWMVTVGELTFGPADAVIEEAAAARARKVQSDADFAAGVEKFRTRGSGGQAPEINPQP